MRALLVPILALTLLAPRAAAHGVQGLADLAARADAASDSGRHRDALRGWLAVHEVAEGDPVPLYLAARAAAKAGDPAAGIDALGRAIADGFVPRRPLEQDSTIAALRAYDGWAALVRQASRIAAARDTALRREILDLAARDQQGRAGLDSIFRTYGVPSPQADSAFARMAAIDSPVQARLRALIAARGWPGRALVGDDAAHAVWLVVQHMDEAEQRKLLPLLQAAVRRNDARAADAALLEDRLGTSDGKPQRYGSQLRHPKPGAPPDLFPIDKPECVDRRRAAVKLAPIATYLTHFGVTWTPPTKRCDE
jgi:hypothetical protein